MLLPVSIGAGHTAKSWTNHLSPCLLCKQQLEGWCVALSLEEWIHQYAQWTVPSSSYLHRCYGQHLQNQLLHPSLHNFKMKLIQMASRCNVCYKVKTTRSIPKTNDEMDWAKQYLFCSYLLMLTWLLHPQDVLLEMVTHYRPKIMLQKPLEY